jgi:hypothetical protein
MLSKGEAPLSFKLPSSQLIITAAPPLEGSGGIKKPPPARAKGGLFMFQIPLNPPLRQNSVHAFQEGSTAFF